MQRNFLTLGNCMMPSASLRFETEHHLFYSVGVLKTHILFFYHPETYLIFLLSEDAPLRQGTLETRDPGSRSASLAHLTDAATLMCRTAALKGEVARGLAAGLGPNPLSLNCDICTAIGIVLSVPWGESGIGNAREATAGNVKP